MQKQSLNILLIEDDESAAALVREALAETKFFRFELTAVPRLSAACAALKRHNFDVALADLGLPDSFGLETYKKLVEMAPTLPVIILSGNTDEETALECVMQGAQDYLVKGTFNNHTLPRAIHYAIERKKIESFKDDFASLVSHELRAPLAVVKGAIDGIKDGGLGPLNEKQDKLMQLASKNANRLSKIISNILDLSRLESGHAVVNLSAIAVKTLVEDALMTFQDMAAKTGKQLTANIAPDLPPAYADPDLISEVFCNLITNGIRFAKSSLNIGAAPASAELVAKAFKVAAGGAAPKGSFLHFTIKDDGPGIEPGRIKDLFNKFVQLGRRSGGSDYKGTGLGLSISKKIVELLGGRIWAESELGHGAAFHFILPIAD